MNKLILTIIGICFTIAAMAQNNNVLNFNPHFQTVASKYQPSLLGDDFKRAEITFPLNMHIWAGNSAIGYDRINHITTGGLINNDFIDGTLGQLNDKNYLGVGFDLQILSAAFKVKTGGKSYLAIGLTHTERFGMNLVYGENLFKTAFEGNKQFAGENVNLGPFKMNLLYYREFALTGAYPLYLSVGGNKELRIKPGIRLRYLQGVASLYTEKGDVNMFTASDGRYIDFGFDYAVHASIPDSNFNPFKPSGKGFATDIGVTASISNIDVTLTVADVGGINFKENVTNYKNNQTERYEGVVVDFYGDGSQNQDFEPDSVIAFFRPEKTNEAYKMPLGTKIILQVGYKMGERKTKKEEVYFKHNFYFTYVQGTNDVLNTTTRPYLAGGYTHSFGNIANMGASLGFGGYNKFTFGPHISLNAGALKLGVGSSNVMPLFVKKAGSGVDVQMNMALSF